MSDKIYVVVVEDEKYGTEIEGVFSDLSRAIDEVEHQAYLLAADHNIDLDEPEDDGFVTWGSDRSYCEIEQIGIVWIADRVVDYIE